MSQAALRANRRDYLRDYILACVRDNVLSLGDLASAEVVEKLLRTVSSDVREVAVDILRSGARNGLSALGAWLATKR